MNMLIFIIISGIAIFIVIVGLRENHKAFSPDYYVDRGGNAVKWPEKTNEENIRIAYYEMIHEKEMERQRGITKDMIQELTDYYGSKN